MTAEVIPKVHGFEDCALTVLIHLPMALERSPPLADPIGGDERNLRSPRHPLLTGGDSLATSR